VLLGRIQNTGAQATITVDLPQGFQVFEIIARVAGYSGNDIARLQFNRDTGNNYASREWVSTSITNVATGAIAGIRCATVGITGPRGLIWARVEKRLSSLVARVIGHTHSDQEGSATAPLMYGFRGTWNNTSSLITSVSLNGGAGGATLNAGSYLEVWGALDTF
jgi:protein subunit release factor B